jgi:hypothetical protein
MKTAMQELIDRFDSPTSRKDFIDWLVKNSKTLIEEEKEQIIEAFNQGIKNFENNLEQSKRLDKNPHYEPKWEPLRGDVFYKETYNTKENE